MGIPRSTGVLAGLLLLPLLGGCGLFRSEPEPPSLRAVEAARQRDAPEWQFLEEIWRLQATDPRAARSLARARAAEYPKSVRIAVLHQDLSFQLGDPQVQRVLARRVYEEDPTARNAYLYARVVEDRDRRAELLEEALKLDGDLLQVRVHQIALRSLDGQPDVLADLIGLLRSEPGLAEGWRLLGELGSQYARPDLTRAAIRTEPWSAFEDRRWVILARARAELGNRDPMAVLEELRPLPGDHREACLMRAAALAEVGRPQVASDLLRTLLERDPLDTVALFNLGLLERDYLFRPEESAYWFQAFLTADATVGGGDLQRRAQAQLWLEEARPSETRVAN